MFNRVAVIDLGSNTFHLLIVDVLRDGFKEVYRERIFVYLAKGGVGSIDPDRFDYGLQTMKKFAAICESYNVNAIHAVGTSALRSANNAGDFVNQVSKMTGITIEIISGETEAKLIHKACMHFLNVEDKSYLIMDIGGGSVEFISGSPGKALAMQSHTLGVSHLRSIISYSSPMTRMEHKQIREFLGESITWENNNDAPYYLIGASGPFEIIESILGFHASAMGNFFYVNEVLPIVEKVLFSTKEERFKIKGMPQERADLSLESMLLMDYVLYTLPGISKLVVSPYALKEGHIIEKYF